MDEATLQTVADGRVFTGRQAVGLKLIDQLGDEKAAVAWLVAEKKIKSDTPVKNFNLNPRFGDMTFLRASAAMALDALGLGAIARQFEQTGLVSSADRLGLEGMLALWRPATTN
jgi:protease-4